ncbi:trace amine-associated receptor 7a-like [Cervus elaphus]|uniref:trace amine-associated receptor 7a-like n=1 Tax=Cervus elaphus TaxID=9860 RepID=UPI001CC2DAFB|nr:trace amine-associated receptor 7a-like [Cervus elaphus]
MSTASPAAAVPLCYEHLNGSCVKTPYSPGPRLILYTVFIFGTVLAVFGNLLVMISILHFKQLHSPTNFLIASLACADFLVGVTVMPFSTVRSVESCWYFGQRYCQLHSCFEGSFCYASIYHLCFISLDRYIAVSDPLVYPARVTVSVSGLCIAFSWLFSIIFSFSLLGTGANAAGLEDLVSALTCVGGCQIAVNQSWVLVDFLLFFIPTLVMIVLYSKIFLIAKQQARQIESLSNKTGRCSDSYQGRVAKRERKAARTLGVAVLAFLVSWLPYFLDSIIDAFLGFITPTHQTHCHWQSLEREFLNSKFIFREPGLHLRSLLFHSNEGASFAFFLVVVEHSPPNLPETPKGHQIVPVLPPPNIVNTGTGSFFLFAS